MTLYESNYIKLEQLFGQISSFVGVATSRSTIDLDLHLAMLRRDRYTTTLKMTYLFPESVEGVVAHVADPDLTVRVYHDAKLVDVGWTVDRHRHYKLRELAGAHTKELDQRWRSNIMLNKWLDYLLEMQHVF